MGQQARDEDGFSLLELVVVVAVLAILAAIGIPMFNFFIKQAAYVAGQWSLASARSTCAVNKSVSIPTGFFGTQFSSSNSSSICDGNMTASFDGGCQISINLKDGGKTSLGTPGWPSSLDTCSSQALVASQESVLQEETSSDHADSANLEIQNTDGIPRDSNGKPKPFEVTGVWDAGMGCRYSAGLLKLDNDFDPHINNGKDFKGGATAVALSPDNSDSYPNVNNEPNCRFMEIPEHWFEANTRGEPWEIKKANPLKCRENMYCQRNTQRWLEMGLFNEEGNPVMAIPPDTSEGNRVFNSMLKKYWNALHTVEDTISQGMN